MCFILLLSVSFCFSQKFWGQHKSPSVVVRHNYGVAFKFKGLSTPTVGYWPHTFHFVLPSFEKIQNKEDWCTQPLYTDLCKEFPFLIEIAMNFTNRTFHQFHHSLQAVYDLMPNSPVSPDLTKRKRSLFPFIGKLSSSLFGTVSEDDLNVVASHVQSISKSQSQLLNAFQVQTEHMSSYMSLSQERMNNFDELVHKQYVALFDTILADRQWLTKHDNNLNLVLFTMFSKLYDYLSIQNQVQELYNSMQMLVSGFLPSSLIPATILTETITAIDETFTVPFSHMSVVEKDPIFYYTSHNFLVFRNESDLFITVKFPVVSGYVNYLNVYEVITFPVPFHNDSNLVTILTTQVKYLLISWDTEYYAELNTPPSEINKFSVDFLVPTKQFSCLYVLFQDKTNFIQEECNFQVRNYHDIKTELYIINYPQILIRSPYYLDVTCPYPIQKPPPCSHCFYTVPCACSVETEGFLLPSRATHCNFTDILPSNNTPQYPVNLALLQHFFDNETLSAFAGDTLLSHPLFVELPPMKFFNHSFDDRLATSQSIAYELDKVINATKSDQNIYRSIVDPLLFGDLTIPSSFFFTPPGYLAIVTTGMASFNLVFTFWLAYRLRLVNAALAVLVAHPPVAHARTFPPYLIATLTPSTTIAPFFTLPYTPSFDFVGYLILILLLLIIVRKLCKCRTKHFESSPDFDLCLEIKSKGRCFFLTLQTVSGCPTDYIVSGSTLSSHIAVEGWISPKVNITWGDILIKYKYSNRLLTLPSHYKISIINRFKLGSVFSNNYECFLFFAHAGRGSYVTLTNAQPRQGCDHIHPQLGDV